MRGCDGFVDGMKGVLEAERVGVFGFDIGSVVFAQEGVFMVVSGGRGDDRVEPRIVQWCSGG